MSPLARLLLVVLALTGCAGPLGEDVPERTITVQEADQRVERHLREVTAAIPAQRLEPLSPPLTTPCGGIIGGPDDGRVTASRSYWLRDIAPDQADAAVQAAIDYWTANGYQVSTRSRQQGIVRAAAPDGTTELVMQRTPKGDVTLVADSICVWPDGNRPTTPS